MGAGVGGVEVGRDVGTGIGGGAGVGDGAVPPGAGSKIAFVELLPIWQAFWHVCAHSAAVKVLQTAWQDNSHCPLPSRHRNDPMSKPSLVAMPKKLKVPLDLKQLYRNLAQDDAAVTQKRIRVTASPKKGRSKWGNAGSFFPVASELWRHGAVRERRKVPRRI